MPQPRVDAGGLARYVAAFRADTGHDGPVGHMAFDDSPEVQTSLGELVLAGTKRATAGLHGVDVTPIVGQHDVVLDGAGTPLCVIRTQDVQTLPFGMRGPAFAWDEGEGDRTLEHWTRVHLEYFERVAVRADTTFSDESLVDFERFTVVHPPESSDTAPVPLLREGEIVVRPVLASERRAVDRHVGGAVSAAGWAPGDCPALLAERGDTTTGVLVFVPAPDHVEVVSTVVLEEGSVVGDCLTAGLDLLAARHGWGVSEG